MATILFAIGAAVATEAAAGNKAMTTRYQLTLDECKSISSSECDGPATNPVCSNVFAQPNCTGPTFRNN